jgi:hypothetical protein
MRSSALVSVCVIISGASALGCDGSRTLDPSESDRVPLSARAANTGLASPSNASAVALATPAISVTWVDNSDNETGFEVQRSSSGAEGNYDVVLTVGANAVAVEDRAVSDATQYCYRIRAVRVTGKKAAYSLFSNTSCVTTVDPNPPVMPSMPATPTNVTATPISESELRISWQDNSSDETGFTVSRVGFNPFAVVPANTVTAVSYALSQGVEYCYQVKAYHTELMPDNVSRTSYAASDTACATIPVPTSPPEGSYAISVRPSGTGAFEITRVWSGAPNPPPFKVYRSVTDGSTWTQVNLASESYNTLSDYSITNEQKTCYRVIAYNIVGDGPPSNTACATYPNAPGSLAATWLDAETVELRWTDNSSSEEAYQVMTWIVQGSPDNSGTWEYEGGVVAEVPANATSVRIPRLTPDPYTSVWYFVVAKKDGGRSGSTELVSTSP